MARGAKRRRLYERILIKVSREAVMGDQAYGIDIAPVEGIAGDLKEIVGLGVRVCVVVSGGNMYRGLSAAARGMDRVTGDYMGMLATNMNGWRSSKRLSKTALA